MSADFVERRDPADFDTSADAAGHARNALAEKGCTWFRFHTSPQTGRMIVEGWKVRPANADDEGPLPTDELA